MFTKPPAEREWMESNGAGGFACGTIGGEIRRFWHGLAWVALKPPTNRIRLVAGVEERVGDGGAWRTLSATYDGAAWRAADVAAAFAPVPTPEWRWDLGNGATLVRRVAMPRFGAATLLEYRLEGASAPVALSLRFVLAHDPGDVAEPFGGALGSVEGHPVVLTCLATATAGAIAPSARQLVEHATERDCEEEPSAPLWFLRDAVVTLEPGKSVWIAIGTAPFDLATAPALVAEETARRAALTVPGVPEGRASAADLNALALAADRYIVRRGDGRFTIMAGYPWFTDWGRDTMISLTGLSLATRRFDDARSILEHFLAHSHQGLIPNLFPEAGTAPQFNTIDATLWLFEAVFRYADASGDRDFLRENLARLDDIIAWHERGTVQEIRLEPDGLLRGGTPGSQLTWMDVKVNGEVPTPRHGKPIEIQGLWYNALLRLAEAGPAVGLAPERAAHLRALAERARAAFTERFVLPDRDHLADVVDRDAPGTVDVTLRPNMIIPFGLAHNIVPEGRRAPVLRAAARRLLTPSGLRSLDPAHPKYNPIYRGDRLARDRAYHQGTVWMWLMAPFAEGIARERMRVPELAERLPAIEAGLWRHFREEGCLANASEIFDADAPHAPRGCFGQAWSVAALAQIVTRPEVAK